MFVGCLKLEAQNTRWAQIAQTCPLTTALEAASLD